MNRLEIFLTSIFDLAAGIAETNDKSVLKFRYNVLITALT